MKKFIYYIIIFTVTCLFIISCISFKSALKWKREALKNEIYKDPAFSIEQRVENLLSLMTLAEKVGQMTQAVNKFVTEQ